MHSGETHDLYEVFLFRAVIEFQVDPEKYASIYGDKSRCGCSEKMSRS